MKINRNDDCSCGSGKKYKHCCEHKRFQPTEGNRYVRWLISLGVAIVLAVSLWGVVDYIRSEKIPIPEGAVWCANCGKYHAPNADTQQ